jgi:hypothetical protein
MVDIDRTDSDAAIQSWNKIIAFYQDLVQERGWDFLQPLFLLVRRIAASEYAKTAYASTSMTALCVSLLPGFNPDSPNLVISVDKEGLFEFALCQTWGQPIETQICSASHSYSVLESMMAQLKKGTEKARCL